jgi:hypothetical protein
MTWRKHWQREISRVVLNNPGASNEELRKEASKLYPQLRKRYPYRAFLLALEDVLGPSARRKAAITKKRTKLNAEIGQQDLF